MQGKFHQELQSVTQQMEQVRASLESQKEHVRKAMADQYEQVSDLTNLLSETCFDYFIWT